MTKLLQRTYRTGVQTLWYDEDEKQFYVSIKNRTYSSMVPIPLERVSIWQERLEFGDSVV